MSILAQLSEGANVAKTAIEHSPILGIFAVFVVVIVAIFLMAMKKMVDVFLAHNREIAERSRITEEKLSTSLDKLSDVVRETKSMMERTQR